MPSQDQNRGPGGRRGRLPAWVLPKPGLLGHREHGVPGRPLTPPSPPASGWRAGRPRRFVALLAAALALAACATPEPAFTPSRAAFFDPRLFEGLELGRATPADARKRLGEPYLTAGANAGRVMWVYDFSATQQAVLYFRDDLLVEREWTTSYLNPVSPELIFEARPELRGLPRD